jgi:predicted TIM-barrel fold metal-dependent hydrolase
MEKYLAELEESNEELYKKYRRFMPNYHYTFVEYAGSNLVHWCFSDDYADQLEDKGLSKRLWYTLMPDFRSYDPFYIVELASKVGFRGITFHSYLQKITPLDYSHVVELAKFANSLGMFTGICTAYGSKGIYDFHSLPLAVEILNKMDGPLVLYHAGGARIIEAFLLCEMWPNLYLETSFSLSYWLNSSIELDLAFSIRKLGVDRFMFGSDAPFVTVDKALIDHSRFLDRHGFSQSEGEMLLGGTARSVFPFLNKNKFDAQQLDNKKEEEEEEERKK